MSSTPRNAIGSRQTVSSELTPQEFHLNCRSDRAALIACDGLDTVRTVTGREYHYSLCGLWRNRELPDILSRQKLAHHLSSLAAIWQVMACRCTRLCSSQSQRGSIWRMNIRLSRSYPVFATQMKTGWEDFVLSPSSRWETVKFPSTSKNFLIFL